MTFASDRGFDLFGIGRGGLMGNPAGGRREKASGTIIPSIGDHIFRYLYLSCAPCYCIKMEEFSVVLLPFEAVTSEGSSCETNPGNNKYGTAQLWE